MAIIILPDAQEDLYALQTYMLDRWDEPLWAKAEDEIFEKLSHLDTGLLAGAVVDELARVGILDYRYILTSHHKLVYKNIHGNIFVYIVAGQKQDFQTILFGRLLRR